MTPPLRFSVIVPTRDRPDSLRACVASLAALEAPPGGFEVIVVDDGNGLPELPTWVRTAATAGRGPGAARNQGASLAGGEMLAFTDDDCMVDPAWLVELDRAAREHPGAGIGGASVNGFPGRPLSVANQLVMDAVHHHYTRDGAPTFIASLNLAVPALAFRDLGGFDEGFRHAEDRELCVRWLRAGYSFAWAPIATVTHRRVTDAGGFALQHAGYGRGAYAVHLRDGDGAIPDPEPRFYAELARRVRRSRGGGVKRPSLAALVLFTQIAGVAGFALEGLAVRRGIGRRTYEPGPCPGAIPASTELDRC